MEATQRAVKNVEECRNSIYRAGDPCLFHVGINAIANDSASAQRAKHPMVLSSDSLVLTTKGQN